MDKFIVESMNVYYGDFHALKNINMKLAGNRITAFIGPSGCGTSTFLKTLNRMNDLVEGSRVEGTILLDGDDIYREMDLIDLRTKAVSYTHLDVYKRQKLYDSEQRVCSLSVDL